MVPFGASVRSALSSYLARRADVETKQVFVNQYGEPITRHGVAYMLRERGKAAGITGVRLSPHTLRHTFARTWLLNGGDAMSLQKMLGHSSLEMVRNYVNLAASDVSAIHRNVSPADRIAGSAKPGRKRIR